MAIALIFNKKVELFVNKFISETFTVKGIIEHLGSIDKSPLLISVTWQVVEGEGIPTVKAQNNTMLRRAKKIADALGRTVEAFDQLDGVTYGCGLLG